MKLTMRKSLVITILLMGLLTVSFAVITGEVFTRLSLENRADAFRELAELEVHNRWHRVRDEAIEMGFSIRQAKKFKQLYREKDTKEIIENLDQHFHRAYVTLGLLDLKKLRIYDLEMNTRWASTEGEPGNVYECPGLIDEVKQRSGAERLKTVSKVCAYKNELRLMVVMPLGGLRVDGYLAVVVDPVRSLAKSEEGLGIPLSIQTLDGELIHRSPKWPAEQNMHEALKVSYLLKAGNSQPVAEFLFMSDVKKLYSNISQTRYFIITVAVIITIVAMIIALWLLRRTIITPLFQITQHMHLIRSDKTYLKENIVIRGSSELEELACDLNEMSSELHHLYYDLETMAFTDALTGIPNRALLFDRLQQAIQYAERDQNSSEFALMMMDLNRFKAVNDELGHHVGDKLLQAVAGRLKQALRASDTVARLGGDEFAVLLYSVKDADEAEAVAAKIAHLMSPLFDIDGFQLDVGFSLGIARFPEHSDNSSHLMQCADMAMYYAKENKIPYAFYSREIESMRKQKLV